MLSWRRSQLGVLPTVATQAANRRRFLAFSLLELLVCLGVVFVLIGLLLPSIAKAKIRAKAVGDKMTAHQAGALLTIYTSDYRDAYPVWDTRPVQNAIDWYQALVLGGYASSTAEIDPDAPVAGRPTYAMSIALCYDAGRMVPGRTVAPRPDQVSVVRVSDIRFPSYKGALVQYFVVGGDPQDYWCCLPSRPSGTVSMCDNSVRSGPWTSFVRDDDPPTENGIGFPVFSTWSGALGTDWRDSAPE